MYACEFGVKRALKRYSRPDFSLSFFRFSFALTLSRASARYDEALRFVECKRDNED